MVQRIKTVQESDLRMLGSLARSIQRVLPVTQADIDAAAALGKGWVVTRVLEVSDPLDNLRGGTQLVIRQNSILPGQNVQRVLIVSGPGGETIIVRGVPPLSLIGAVENSVEYVNAYGGLLQSGVPSGYTAVEYVENAADTMVKTAIHIGNEDNFKMDITATVVGGSFYLFQARDAVAANYGNATICGISGSQNGGTIIGGSGGSTALTSGITRPNRDGHKLNIVFDCADGDMSLYVKDIDGNVSDTQTGTYDPTELTRPTTNMCIYGNEAPTVSTALPKNRLTAGCKVYGAKLWKNGVLVMDYVPATRDSDSAVGFYDRVSHTFITAADGSLTAGNSLAPTPSDPIDFVCNNGALKILDKSDWTIFTNPTSIAGQGVFISTDGKWYSVNDKGAGVAIPLTIGKQYTLVIHKKTAELGTILRYGQSPQATPTNVGVQLTDWYRGDITDGQMVSFVAKQAYFVMQFSSVVVEAGMVQEAIEVLEAQGGDYTFLEYIEATGTQYIETGLSGAMRWVGSGQGTSESSGSKVIVSAKATTGGDIKGAVIFLASRYGSTEARKYWTLGGAGTGVSISNVGTNTFAKYDVTFADDKFIGKINDEILGAVTNSWSINEWRIGTSFANQTGNPAYYFVGNIYRQQAYQNNVLVGDFIPAIRNSDNVVGMYDTVSGTFFTNAGTGAFVAGPVISDGEVLKLTPSNDTAGVANLLKIDDYVDTQEILTGLINHQLGIYVFDGTEDWTWSNGANAPARLTIPELAYVLNTDVAPVMCSHFMPTFWNNLSPTTKTTPYVAVNQTNQPTAKRIVFTAAWDANITDAESWKTFLATQYSAGTPVIVVYPLATAQDEVAPIPQTMQTVAGDNTLDIVQAGMSGLEVEVKYTTGVAVSITEVENAQLDDNITVTIS